MRNAECEMAEENAKCEMRNEECGRMNAESGFRIQDYSHMPNMSFT